MMGYKRDQYSEVMARINEPRGKCRLLLGHAKWVSPH